MRSLLLVPDESKTHLFLSPFFEYISGLKIKFNAKLWSFHPNFLFCINLKKISRIQQKKGAKIGMVQRNGQCRDIASAGFSVATLCGESLEIMAMSRHQLKKGKQRHNNVATS